MISFFKNLDWKKFKIDITKILGRLYYFNFALFWWVADLIVFNILGVNWKLLIVSVPLGIITFYSTTKWLGSLIYSNLCKFTKNNLIELLDRSNALQGVPGCGKTSTINQMGFELAKIQWKQLQHSYWKICKTPYSRLSKRLQDKYSETIRAYNFYKKHENTHIPCLHSFISIKVGDRISHQLSKAHLLQELPLPYKSVWVCDEISSLFPNSVKGDTKERNKKLSQLCRWIRHFTDSYALFADIRFGDAFLSIRSGCGCVLTLEKKQRWILKPKFLTWLINFLYSFIDFDFFVQRITKKGSSTFNKSNYSLKKSSNKLSKFVSWLERLKSCVGYREYYYRRDGSLEQEVDSKNILTSKGKYWFKSCLDVSYNERAFKNLYACKDDDFSGPKDSSLELSQDELKDILGL